MPAHLGLAIANAEKPGHPVQPPRIFRTKRLPAVAAGGEDEQEKLQRAEMVRYRLPAVNTVTSVKS